MCVSARFLTIRADAVEADAFDFPLWQVCAAACGVGPAEVAFLDARARLRIVAGAGASAAVANPRCADLVVLSLGGSAAASALLPLSSSLLRIAGACQADMVRTKKPSILAFFSATTHNLTLKENISGVTGPYCVTVLPILITLKFLMYKFKCN